MCADLDEIATNAVKVVLSGANIWLMPILSMLRGFLGVPTDTVNVIQQVLCCTHNEMKDILAKPNVSECGSISILYTLKTKAVAEEQ